MRRTDLKIPDRGESDVVSSDARELFAAISTSTSDPEERHERSSEARETNFFGAVFDDIPRRAM
jgi:hypothetical protein